MESKYKVTGGMVGALGDNAVATNFTQVWHANSADIDLRELAEELVTLRGKVAAVAKDDPSHLAELDKLDAAQRAAMAGDGPSVLERLKSLSSWFWSAATTIGIGLATAAAKRALGS